jgi:E3 ubiquitin-protein ligase makorin
VYLHLSFQVFRRQRLRHGQEFFGVGSDTELADRLRILQDIIGDPTNSLHVALNFVRRHLPAIWNGMDGESGTSTDALEGESVHEDDEDHQVLELLVSHLRSLHCLRRYV